MKQTEIVQNGNILVPQAAVADSFLTRFKGLMLRKGLEPGEGLLLRKCSSIHCFFMRFPIDVIYLDKGFRVLCTETVAPWHVGSLVRHARHVLEVEAGRGMMFITGDAVTVRERKCSDG